ncbi:MAG: hypothetical protein CMI63_21570 [Parvularcula sp.]|nr:hypothetical protein [Parvularcula sp.]
MTSNDPKEVVLKFFETMNNGEFEEAADFFSLDAVFWVVGSLPFSGTLRGRDEILEKNFRPSAEFTEPGSAKVIIGDVIAEGDKVAVEWRFQRKTLGGESYDNYFFGLFEVRDGLIQSFREYLDTEYARRMLWKNE